MTKGSTLNSSNSTDSLIPTAVTILDSSRATDWYLNVSSLLQVHTNSVLLSVATSAGAMNEGLIRSRDGKPNEDGFMVVKVGQKLVLGMYDGSTSLVPIRDFGERFAGDTSVTPARFASHFAASNLARRTNIPSSAKELLLLQSNELRKWCQENLGDEFSDDNPYSAPMSTATNVILDFDTSTLSFAHLGDSFVMIEYRDGTTALLTTNRLEEFESAELEKLPRVAKERGITIREARHLPQTNVELISMLSKLFNRADGQGIGLLNGSRHAIQYIESGKLELTNIAAIFLGTDGIVPLGMSEVVASDRSVMFKLLRDGGPRRLIEVSKRAQAEDPDWNFPRWKFSDDASGILLSF